MTALARKLDSLRDKGGIRHVDIANLLGTRPETVSRWNQGKAYPHANTEKQLLGLEYIIDQLSDFYEPIEARQFLFKRQRLLGEQTPADLIKNGGIDEVVALVQRMRDGVTAEVTSRAHDPDLLDRLAALEQQRFDGEVWRATRLGQDPTAFSHNGGRWAPPSSYQSVPVLYTSRSREGAIAEMTSWLALLVPRPSKPIMVHRLKVKAQIVVSIDLLDLLPLGVDPASYNERNYVAMGEAPPSRTQEIGAALSFLEIDGLIVPSARAAAQNIVLFDNSNNRVEVDVIDAVEIDWIRSFK